MMRQLIMSEVVVGVLGHIDPRTYPVKGVFGGSVKASQRPSVLRRIDQVVNLIGKISLWDGSKIRVVKASIPVGGPREAAIVQREFERAGVNIVVHSMCTWSMGWETQFFGHPEWLELLEAMNGTAWPGAVLLNSLRASATAHLKPVWCSYPEDVEGLNGPEDLHPTTVRNITRFVKAASIVVQERGMSYASIGHVSMGIGGSEAISDIWSRWFGMKLVHFDQLEVVKRIEKGMYDQAEAIKAVTWFFKTFSKIDPNVVRHVRSDIGELVERKLIPMTLVVRDIMRGNDAIKDEERSLGANALLGGTAGQRYFTDHEPNFDLTEAILCSMFDWNGSRPPITVATENDGLNGMPMQWGTMITGLSSLFADLRTYWSPAIIKKQMGVDISKVAPTGFLHLINSGPAALEWGTDLLRLDPEARQAAAIANVEWHPADLGYFPNDGLSTHFRTPPDMPVTLMRMNRVGLDLSLTVVHGHTVAIPDAVANMVRKVTSPTWPDTFVVVDDGDTREYMAEGNDPNHVAAAAGHIGEEIKLVAAMHRMPVDYTNVKADWYPTLWRRLGGDREACRRLGPLYG